MKSIRKVWECESRVERDELLAQLFPSRVGTETPGYYTLPGTKNTLGVVLDTVTLYLNEEIADANSI